MANRSLADEIISIIRSESNNNPPPLIVKLTKVYSNNRADLEYENGNLINVPCSSKGNIGDEGVLIFIDGNPKQPYCILSNADLSNYYTRAEIDEMITGGGVDLSKYVKKQEVDLKFNLESNGYITIGLDVGDGY